MDQVFCKPEYVILGHPLVKRNVMKRNGPFLCVKENLRFLPFLRSKRSDPEPYQNPMKHQPTNLILKTNGWSGETW